MARYSTIMFCPSRKPFFSSCEENARVDRSALGLCGPGREILLGAIFQLAVHEHETATSAAVPATRPRNSRRLIVAPGGQTGDGSNSRVYSGRGLAEVKGCPLWVNSRHGTIPSYVRFAPIADIGATRPLSAMCGRLRVGKSFLSRLQHSSVQPCVRPVSAAHGAAGHNALRGSGPGQ